MIASGYKLEEIAEGLGVKERIVEHYWQTMVLKSDCLVVIQALQSPVTTISTFGAVIDACKSLLASLKNVFF